MTYADVPLVLLCGIALYLFLVWVAGGCCGFPDASFVEDDEVGSFR